jgi:hypothetical protein
MDELGSEDDGIEKGRLAKGAALGRNAIVIQHQQRAGADILIGQWKSPKIPWNALEKMNYQLKRLWCSEKSHGPVNE